MSQNENESQSRKHFSLGGPKEILVVLFLLVVFSRIGGLYSPLLLGALGFTVFYYLIRAGFYFGKTTGWTTIALLLALSAGVGYIQHDASLKHQALLARLADYEEITIQRENIFPTSPIIQISAENDVTNDDLSELANMPELAEVTHIFLKNTEVTDDGLLVLDGFPSLTYVFVESSIISPQALFRYEQEHPEITLIVYSGTQ